MYAIRAAAPRAVSDVGCGFEATMLAAGHLDAETIEGCIAALIETLRAHHSDAGIRLGSAAWLVVAHRPERRS
jgi:hypothetical protein